MCIWTLHLRLTPRASCNVQGSTAKALTLSAEERRMRRDIGANSNLLPIDHDLFATGVFAMVLQYISYVVC